GGVRNVQNFVGGPGTTNALIGPDTANTWTISGANSGTVGNYAFNGFQELTGGAANDTFVFQQNGSIAVSVDGGGATNTRDSPQSPGDIHVDLLTTSADLGTQGASNGIANIENVTGSIGNDLLVGDATPNALIGGTGRNVLIGGSGADTLDASRATS